MDIDELIAKVASGDSQAKYELGDRLFRGDGVEPDLRKALHLIQEAADDEVNDAIVWLDDYYGDDEPDKQDR